MSERRDEHDPVTPGSPPAQPTPADETAALPVAGETHEMAPATGAAETAAPAWASPGPEAARPVPPSGGPGRRTACPPRRLPLRRRRPLRATASRGVGRGPAGARRRGGPVRAPSRRSSWPSSSAPSGPPGRRRPSPSPTPGAAGSGRGASRAVARASSRAARGSATGTGSATATATTTVAVASVTATATAAAAGPARAQQAAARPAGRDLDRPGRRERHLALHLTARQGPAGAHAGGPCRVLRLRPARGAPRGR